MAEQRDNPAPHGFEYIISQDEWDAAAERFNRSLVGAELRLQRLRFAAETKLQKARSRGHRPNA